MKAFERISARVLGQCVSAHKAPIRPLTLEIEIVRQALLQAVYYCPASHKEICNTALEMWVDYCCNQGDANAKRNESRQHVPGSPGERLNQGVQRAHCTEQNRPGSSYGSAPQTPQSPATPKAQVEEDKRFAWWDQPTLQQDVRFIGPGKVFIID
jgi:hypothetical protein